MCIRDRAVDRDQFANGNDLLPNLVRRAEEIVADARPNHTCLLYTSDAADERSSVDLGGRRILKKTHYHQTAYAGTYSHKAKHRPQ